MPRHPPCALISLTFFTGFSPATSPYQSCSNHFWVLSLGKNYSFSHNFTCFLIRFLSSLFSSQGTLWGMLPHSKNIASRYSSNPLLRKYILERRSFNFDLFGIFFRPPRTLVRKGGKNVQINKIWWAQVDSNHRPRAYQARALTA